MWCTWLDTDTFVHAESVRVQDIATSTPQSCEEAVKTTYTHVVPQHRLRSGFSTQHVLY